MKRLHSIVFVIVFLSVHGLQGAFLQQLVQAQESRGIRVTSPEEMVFEQKVKNLAAQLSVAPALTNVSQENIEQIGMLMGAFYSLFFDPACIRFSTRENMNNFFEQLRGWQDQLKKQNIMINWPAGAVGQELQILLVQALKEICLFGRYAKHKEEHLVTFRLRMQYMLTSVMMDSCFALWKEELVSNNDQFASGSFFSWDVDAIKAEFKDSVALAPLFKKLVTTIDMDTEQRAAQQHQQELEIEKQQVVQRKQQEVQKLKDVLMRVQGQTLANAVDRGALYLDSVRILLDPAYMDLLTADRKNVDKIYDQFKNLHTVVGTTFMPIMSQEKLEELKFLVARSLELIHSPVAKQMGGTALKNHVEAVVKLLMTIAQNQTPNQNQIKFQWIKPLYLDNPYLTAEFKKKLLDIFNNQNFQRWQVGARSLTLKVAPSGMSSEPSAAVTEVPMISAEPVAIEPAPENGGQNLTLSSSMQPEVMIEIQPRMELKEEVAPSPVVRRPLPDPAAAERAQREKIAQEKAVADRAAAEKAQEEQRAQEKMAAERAAFDKMQAEQRAQEKAAAERIALEKAQEEKRAQEKAVMEKTEADRVALAKMQEEEKIKAEMERAAMVQKELTPAAAVQLAASTQSADLSPISKSLLSQSLVAPAATVKDTLSKVGAHQKFDLLKMTDAERYTAVHQAASLGRADVIKMLLDGLTPTQRFEIAKMQQNDGQTALHLAASAKSAPTKGFKPLDAVQELLKGLTLPQKVELVTMKDSTGTTAVELAEGSNNKSVVITLKEIAQKRS